MATFFDALSGETRTYNHKGIKVPIKVQRPLMVGDMVKCLPPIPGKEFVAYWSRGMEHFVGKTATVIAIDPNLPYVALDMGYSWDIDCLQLVS